ncbi:uncharacterized protein DS421_15g502290 [Arachis hypogaea]|nr:uncharacterized protein DS421_15g502290 [Arachis hypogaea]
MKQCSFFTIETATATGNFQISLKISQTAFVFSMETAATPELRQAFEKKKKKKNKNKNRDSARYETRIETAAIVIMFI